MHQFHDLICIFERCFYYSENTRLIAGAQEPLYLPAVSKNDSHKIYFRLDYFSSALHECAHWCIAGTERRQQEDYGYWYAPDGRNAMEQKKFYAVEIKPQALECLFSSAAQYPFCISHDNLSDVSGDEARHFEKKVYAQARSYLAEGMPSRAHIFYKALQSHYFKYGEVMMDGSDGSS